MHHGSLVLRTAGARQFGGVAMVGGLTARSTRQRTLGTLQSVRCAQGSMREDVQGLTMKMGRGQRHEKSMRPRQARSMVREYVEAFVFAIVLALVTRQFVVQAFKIPSSSMETTLLVGDHIAVSRGVGSPRCLLTCGVSHVVQVTGHGPEVVRAIPLLLSLCPVRNLRIALHQVAWRPVEARQAGGPTGHEA